MFDLVPDFTGPPLERMPVSLDEVVSLEMIRTHTKTDDVPSVTDEQLRLYRKAAIESAERYTGLLIGERRRIIERIKPPVITTRAGMFGGVRAPRFVKHHLAAGSSDGVVWVYGGSTGGLSRRLEVPIGETEIRIPGEWIPVDYGDCCRPGGIATDEARVLYVAGFSSVDMVPAGVIVGILKWIAWSVENPGDVFRAVNDLTARTANYLEGTSNVAVASGALDMWRQYIPRV